MCRHLGPVQVRCYDCPLLLLFLSLPWFIYMHLIRYHFLSLPLPTYVGGSVCENVCVLSLCLLTSMVEKFVKCISWTFSPHYYGLWGNKESVIMDFVWRNKELKCLLIYTHIHTHIRTHFYKLYLQLFIIVTFTQTCDIFNFLARYMLHVNNY